VIAVAEVVAVAEAVVAMFGLMRKNKRSDSTWVLLVSSLQEVGLTLIRS
jgi:hypothetical protein